MQGLHWANDGCHLQNVDNSRQDSQLPDSRQIQGQIHPQLLKPPVRLCIQTTQPQEFFSFMPPSLSSKRNTSGVQPLKINYNLQFHPQNQFSGLFPPNNEQKLHPCSIIHSPVLKSSKPSSNFSSISILPSSEKPASHLISHMVFPWVSPNIHCFPTFFPRFFHGFSMGFPC